MSLIITVAGLTVGVETPGVELALLRESNGVTETSGAGLDRGGLWELDLARGADLSEAAETELAHLCLSPGEHLTLVGHSHGVVSASSDLRHHLAMEVLNVSGYRGDFNCLTQSKLTLEAATPCVQVPLISQDKRVTTTASNLDNLLIREASQERELTRRRAASKPCVAVLTVSLRKDVTITCQVENVTFTTSNLLNMTDVMLNLLLLAEAGSIVVGLDGSSLLVLVLHAHPRARFAIGVLKCRLNVALLIPSELISIFSRLLS